MSARVARAQFDSLPVFRLGLRPVPIPLQRVGKQDARFCKLWIQFQCFPGGIDNLGPRVARWNAKEYCPKLLLGCRNPDICRSECAVCVDGRLKVSEGLLEAGPVVLL